MSYDTLGPKLSTLQQQNFLPETTINNENWRHFSAPKSRGSTTKKKKQVYFIIKPLNASSLANFQLISK